MTREETAQHTSLRGWNRHRDKRANDPQREAAHARTLGFVATRVQRRPTVPTRCPLPAAFAFIVLRDDAGDADTVVRELRSMVAAKIAKYAVPDQILVSGPSASCGRAAPHAAPLLPQLASQQEGQAPPGVLGAGEVLAALSEGEGGHSSALQGCC